VPIVCDLKPKRLDKAQRRYPSLEITNKVEDVFRHPAVDAVAIATPVSAHFSLALKALEAGKHVLVEKPMTAKAEEAVRLVEEASRRGLVLMVDHTFVYTGAVRQIHELLHSRAIGDVYYYDSVRVNLGLFQHDVNVIWDLAVHDLAIMDYVLPCRPVAIAATGVSHVPGQPENIAYLTVHFEKNVLGHIHVNWLAPVKIRRTLVGGSQRMVVYDDIEPSEKVKVYDRGITLPTNAEQVYEMLISYRTGDMWAPQLDMTEALTREVAHFVKCIETGERPVTDGEVGLRVVQMLEAATLSMKKRGEPVELLPAPVST